MRLQSVNPCGDRRERFVRCPCDLVDAALSGLPQPVPRCGHELVEDEGITDRSVDRIEPWPQQVATAALAVSVRTGVVDRGDGWGRLHLCLTALKAGNSLLTGLPSSRDHLLNEYYLLKSEDIRNYHIQIDTMKSR
jgi:hypothetical protein